MYEEIFICIYLQTFILFDLRKCKRNYKFSNICNTFHNCIRVLELMNLEK